MLYLLLLSAVISLKWSRTWRCVVHVYGKMLCSSALTQRDQDSVLGNTRTILTLDLESLLIHSRFHLSFRTQPGTQSHLFVQTWLPRLNPNLNTSRFRTNCCAPIQSRNRLRSNQALGLRQTYVPRSPGRSCRVLAVRSFVEWL